ncbi:MAG TPA: hypothetical protein VIV14_05830 [Gammaproteobacteria bacterium]
MDNMRITRHWSIAARLIGVLVGTSLAGCASVVTVDAEFPQPLIEKLPVRVGLLFDETLRNYEYYEEIPQQATWTIYLGNANELMLSSLFSTMFLETGPVDAVPLTSTDLFRFDGVLHPELEKFEFEVPIGGNDEFVEVWMQYKLRLYEPDGQLVTEWPVSGYGKAELGNKEEALNRATVVAMREVGATISTRFVEQPGVEYWIQERRNETALSAEAPRIN